MEGTFAVAHPLSWVESHPQKRHVQARAHRTYALTLFEKEVLAGVTQDLEVRSSRWGEAQGRCAYQAPMGSASGAP